jgi:peptide/nickel transport system substrate-binding protein
MKLLRLAGACALAALMIGARAPCPGKVLKVSLSTELQILDPIVTRINSARVFAYLVFDTLVGMDSAGNFRPRCSIAGRSATTG